MARGLVGSAVRRAVGAAVLKLVVACVAAVAALLGLAPTAALATCPASSSVYKTGVTGTSGLIGYWRLDEASGTQACDTAAANHGAYSGGFLLGQAGALSDGNAATSLDGVSGGVRVPNALALNPVTVSVEAWVNTSDIEKADQTIARKDGQYLFKVTGAPGYSSGNLYFRVYRPDGNYGSVQWGSFAGKNVWKHVAATYDGATMRIYEDGREVISQAYAATPPSTASPLTIGARDSVTSPDAFKGRLDEVAVYSRALTATEILDRLDRAAPRTQINSAPPAQATTSTATFAFGSPDATTSFECSIDGDAFAACASPKTYSLLNDGQHTFKARARSGTFVDPTPAQASWTIAGTAVASPYSRAVANDPALLAYWRLSDPFGSTAAAVKGPAGSYGATVQRGKASLLSSDSNAAPFFPNPDGTVEIPHGPAVAPTTAMSVEAWIRPQSSPGHPDGQWTVLTKPGCYAMWTSQDTENDGSWTTFGVYSGGVFASAGKSFDTVGRTTHLVGTYDGATIRFYANGQLIAQTAHSGGIDACTDDLSVGSWGGSSYFVGTIDEPAIYSTALSAAQVAEHYALGSDGTPPSAPRLLDADSRDAEVELEWPDSSEADLDGYDVYRSTGGQGAVKINAQRLTASTYVDASAANDQSYTYTVKAVDRAGNQSASSPGAVGWPSASLRYRDAIADSGSVQGYWRLGERSGTLAEAVAGPAGAYRGSPAIGAASLLSGDTNAAVDLDGVDDDLLVPDSDGLDAGTQFTLGAWVRQDARAAGAVTTILDKAGSYTLGVTGNGLWTASLVTNGQTITAVSSTGPTSGVTYYVAAVYDGATLRLYVNGGVSQSITAKGPVAATTAPLTIGSRAGTQRWNGVIDEPEIHDGALTAADIAKHYDIGSAGTPPAPPVNLVASPSDGQVTLDWADGTEPDLVGYHVYRARTTAGPFDRITRTPITRSVYTDRAVTNETSYVYTARALDDSNHLSAASAQVTATPAVPYGYRRTVMSRPSLAGYWRLGDTSGTQATAQKGPNGTYVNGPQLGSTSLLGSDADPSVRLTTSKVTIPHSPAITPGSAVSVETWSRAESMLGHPDDQWTLLTKPGCYALYVDQSSKWLAFQVYTGGTYVGVGTAAVSIFDRIAHVAGTYDGATIRLYVDGVQIASKAHSGGIDACTNNLTIGDWGGSQFVGNLDETAVYTSALSGTEIKEHYDIGRDGQAPQTPVNLDAHADNGRVALDWNDNAEGDLRGYEVHRATRSGGPFSRVTSSLLTTSSYVDTDVDNDTDYFYSVRARDTSGNASGFSTEARGTPTSAPRLLEPQTVKSHGAELRWTVFDEGGRGGTFDRYELHRDTAAGFTPSASTLIATIRDRSTLRHQDTTAAPSKSFTYKLLVNGVVSGEQTVTTTSDGHARKTLQPDAADGRATWLRNGSCGNRGADGRLVVGGGPEKMRSLVTFPLGDVPAKAPITLATLSLHRQTGPEIAMRVNAHRATTGWKEGGARGACDGSGATWANADGGVPWTAAGADFDPAVAAFKDLAAGAPAGWDGFDLTELVRTWTRGDAANLGVLLKAADETPSTVRSASYASDDHPYDPLLRPKLTVTYEDGSHAQGPVVHVSKPAPNADVRGIVPFTVAATDDRRVQRVEFLLGGNVIGAADSEPYILNWNSATVTNGSYNLSARAIDEAGNATTSAVTTVKVGNSAPPTVISTSPATAYDKTIKNDSPSGHWRLGETSGTSVPDASGNNRHGTLINAANVLRNQPSLVTGDTNPSTQFRDVSATDGGVSITGFSGLLGSAVSAEAIVSYTALATNGTFNRIASRNWGSSGGWLLAVHRNSSGQQVAYWAVNKAGTVVAVTAPVTPGRLHLAGTYDGSALRLYVAGVEKAANTAVGAVALNTTAAVQLGQTLAGHLTVDEAAIYAGTPPHRDQLLNHTEIALGRKPLVKGATTTLRAEPTDDIKVDRVEFFVDDERIGAPVTAAPYQVTLDTLSAGQPVYDGDRTVTSRAYDEHGQQTQAAPVVVNVANAAGTKHQATYTSSVAPLAMTYDPAASPQESHGFQVGVTNTSPVAWGTEVKLRYRWFDGATEVEAGPEQALPALAAGQSLTTPAILQVKPPALLEGVDRAQYTLRIEAYDATALAWFSAKGTKPIEHKIPVQRAAKVALGLEKYYQYDGEELGAGMQHLVNVASGNSIVRWTPFSSPGRGLSTVVDLTYNALERKSESPAGNNWSLSISGLIRFGSQLDIHPNKADDLSGRSNKYVDFTDGDGTTHRFTGVTVNGVTHWQEPPGVHLYLRNIGTDADPVWAITRPDRVTYFFDKEGYPTAVEDGLPAPAARNGNRLTFTLEDVPPGEDPGGPKKRIRYITDAAGNDATPSPDRQFEVQYYSKVDAKKAHVRGRVKRILDHNDSALDFEYYDDGNLLRLIQRGGFNADRSHLPDRTFVFTYTNPNGDAPALTAAERVNPEPKTASQSTRLYSVRDPRGKETTFTYVGTGSPGNRWKLASRRDRAGKDTTYGYPSSTSTTVTAPLSRASLFTYDLQGKVTAIRNPKQETTAIQWTPDLHVEKVTEPSGRTVEYKYDANGYLTEQKAQTDFATATEAAKYQTTTLAYQHLAVDGKDVAAGWKAPRGHGHLSVLDKKTDPAGTASAEVGDHVWDFNFDDRGNLLEVKDPLDRTTAYTPNPDGTIEKIVSAKPGRAPTLMKWDDNGQLSELTDSNGNVTTFGYNVDGLLEHTQDPRHHGQAGGTPAHYQTRLYYDSFHRMGRQSAPKSTEHRPGLLLWSGARYDENDNVVADLGVEEAEGAPEFDAVWTFDYDDMDRQTAVTSPDRSPDPDAGDPETADRLETRYDDAGRVERVLSPLHVKTDIVDDYAALFTYDELDRVVTETQRELTGPDVRTLRTHRCFKPQSGDLERVVSPKAGVTDLAVACAATAPTHSTSQSFDAAHRVRSATDGEGNTSRRTYDANGNVKTVTDPNGTTTPATAPGDQVTSDGLTEFTYTELDQVSRVKKGFKDGTSGRRIVTEYDYDEVGNLIAEVHPRAFNASNARTAGGNYTTRYEYDGVDQVTKMLLPVSADEPEQHYVHRAYDPNGNLRISSLATKAKELRDVADEDLTTVTHFDPGWIRSTSEAAELPDDPDGRERKPSSNVVMFDYWPEGWQRSRDARDSNGDSSDDRKSGWTYDVDGMLKERSERGGGKATYDYDANNNMISAVDAGGADSDGGRKVTVTTSYDELNRPRTTTQRKGDETNGVVTELRYDEHGNVKYRLENRRENQTTGGRAHAFTYDRADRLHVQTDDGPDADVDTDDRRITTTYWPTGWQKQRVIEAKSNGNWVRRQQSDRQYFANGSMKHLKTLGTGTTILAEHTLGYFDAADRFANGHRTSDTFRVRGPKATCKDSDCITSFTYDPRDRVTTEKTTRGGVEKTRSYGLDPAGNVIREEQPGGDVYTSEYVGQQLSKRTVGAGTASALSVYYQYTDEQHLECISETEAKCAFDGDKSDNALEAYAYDGQDRLRSSRTFAGVTGGNNPAQKSAKYDYDALDRPIEEQETHYKDDPNTTIDEPDVERLTAMSYLGTGSQMTEEIQYNGHAVDSNKVKTTKTYDYDGTGQRVGMTDKPTGGSAESYTYATDTQESVSLLVDSLGNAKAQYGYTAYGAEDPEMTEEVARTPQARGEDPTNAYDYTGKRRDSGSGTHDMGARRYDPGSSITMGARSFSPQTGNFLQRDFYEDALSDVGLSLDPLTANRYSLAGGNPVSFIEADGHEPRSSFNDCYRGSKYCSRGRGPRRQPTEPPRDGTREVVTPSVVRPQFEPRPIKRGVDNAVKDTVSETASMLQDPIGTVTGTADAIVHPRRTIKAIGDTCDATSADYCIPYVIMQGAGAKGAGTGIRAGRAGSGRRGSDSNSSGAPTCARARSFGAATRVLMAEGSTKEIKDVQAGDWVVAAEPHTGRRVARRVSRVWVHPDELSQLVVDGGTIATTEDHPFWNASLGVWSEAQALRSGTLLLAADGGTLEVSAFVPVARRGLAYNLEVAGLHTYFVQAGARHVLVHNCDVEDVLKNPALHLSYNTSPSELISKLGTLPENWEVQPSSQGTRQGQGTKLVEMTPEGNETGRQIRFHGGGGRHGPDPYWTIVQPNVPRIKIVSINYVER